MSIYIPGMEIPQSCAECLNIGWHYVFECCLDDMEDGKKLSSCPLVPVPPHGRLIDADALKTKGTDIRDTWVDYDGIEDTVRGFSLDMLDHAPTIIPAEIISENEIKIIDTKGKSNYDPKRRFVISASGGARHEHIDSW